MADIEVDGAFLRNAILDTVVPEASESDVGDALNAQSEDGDPDSLLPTLAQRSLLFFGMLST